MGYHTDFHGHFTVTPPLKPEHAAYLRAFSETRRMKRNPRITETFPDPLREAALLPIGHEGGYYVGARGENCGQDRTPDIVDYNREPAGQPGLWCQWIPPEVEEGEACDRIEWDGGEKFYSYVEWLEYLIVHFLKPWGYSLSGEVAWDGEAGGDSGVIYARGHEVEAVDNVNPGPSWR